MCNRWRLQKSTPDAQPTFKIKISNIVWEWKEKEVFAEIATLMNIRHAATKTPGWFAYKSKAIGNVISTMPDREIQKMRREIEHREWEGNPEHIKRK